METEHKGFSVLLASLWLIKLFIGTSALWMPPYQASHNTSNWVHTREQKHMRSKKGADLQSALVAPNNGHTMAIRWLKYATMNILLPHQRYCCVLKSPS